MAEEKAVTTPAVSVGEVVSGTVEHIAPYGAFIRLETGQKAMVHISELAHSYVKKVEDVLELQQKVTAKVIKIDERGRIDLSIKALQPREPRPPRGGSGGGGEGDFERKLSFFMKTSDEKIADLNSKMKDARGGKRKPGKK